MDFAEFAKTVLTIITYIFVAASIIAGVIWLLSKGIRTVPEGYQDVIFRLDRLAGSRGPGPYLLIPFFERVDQRVSIKNEQIRLPGEKTAVSDGVEVSFTLIVYYKVVNPGLAVTRMADYQSAVSLVAQSAFQDAISSSTLTEVLNQRAFIAGKIKDILDRKTQETIREAVVATTPDETVLWGLRIISVDIKDLDLPDDMNQQMSRQAIAERDIQARITLADSEQYVAGKLAEADKIYQEHPGARQLRNSNQLLETIGPKDKVIILLPTDQLGGLNSGLAGAVALQSANGFGGNDTSPDVKPDNQS